MSQSPGRTYSEGEVLWPPLQGGEDDRAHSSKVIGSSSPGRSSVTRSSLQNLLFPPQERRRLGLLIQPSKSPPQAWQTPHAGPLGVRHHQP